MSNPNYRQKDPVSFDTQDWLKVLQSINRDRSRQGQPIIPFSRVQVWASVIEAICFHSGTPIDQERADLLAKQIRDY